MKTIKPPICLSPLSILAFLGASLLALSQPILAAPIIGIASPGQPALIDWSNELDDDTGVTVLNRELSGDNEISIELLQEDPAQKFAAPDGFVLLDNTLRVTSTNPAGARQIRIRMDYGRYGRTDLRRLGIRANTLRILRADIASGRWLPAVRRINEQRIADVRYLRASAPEFILGYHGFDQKNQFAWAVTDTKGDQFFALAGAAVPLPAAWLLFSGGAGLLLLVARKGRGSTQAT